MTCVCQRGNRAVLEVMQRGGRAGQHQEPSTECQNIWQRVTIIESSGEIDKSIARLKKIELTIRVRLGKISWHSRKTIDGGMATTLYSAEVLNTSQCNSIWTGKRNVALHVSLISFHFYCLFIYFMRLCDFVGFLLRMCVYVVVCLRVFLLTDKHADGHTGRRQIYRQTGRHRHSSRYTVDSPAGRFADWLADWLTDWFIYWQLTMTYFKQTLNVNTLIQRNDITPNIINI